MSFNQFRAEESIPQAHLSQTISNTESKYSYGINTRNMDTMDPMDIEGYPVYSYDNSSQSPINTEKEEVKESWGKRFADSFKRVEPHVFDPSLTQTQEAYLKSASSPLKRKLQSRHLQMIAIGGSIGAALFVGAGTALHTGGPAGVLIVWILSSAMIYLTVQALGELAVTFPVSGSFIQFNTRFISAPWGFAMAWNYVFQWIYVLPLELVAVSMTISYWNDTISPAVWVTIFYLVICGIAVFGVRGYGEVEFGLSFIKVLAIIGFIILGIVLECGGGPKGGYIGGKHWHHPGAFANGFKGVCTIFPTAAFSFAGTELVGLAAAETDNPRKTLPSATKQVFWRISLFYITSLVLIGLLVPYNDPRLQSPTSSVDAKASPFVIAIENGGIKGLPSVMNAVIMISVFSVGNSSVYACSRTVVSLAEQGFAPEWFGYIDRAGRPLVGLIITLAFGLLGYLAVTSKQGVVFTWLNMP
ncbi:unnamed protein product [Ambrosiozyma monospora]|uniref:Unnamed protein product n=1 Tax=Ambrosiozyma monospora TaxID=43982 RepID=A0ACB5SX00_AMBMO|nr:unnamed protein product [Ambrosiozyma monospora]